MTDDRDLSWDTFAEDLEAAMQGDDQKSPRENSEIPRKTLSSALEQHERAIDRTMKAIDNVVGQLRDVVAHPEAKPGQDRRLLQAGIRNAETRPPRAWPTPEQATPPRPASEVKAAPSAIAPVSPGDAEHAVSAQVSALKQAAAMSASNTNQQAAGKQMAEAVRSAPAPQEKRPEERPHQVLQTPPHSVRPFNPPTEMRSEAGHPAASTSVPDHAAATEMPNFLSLRQLLKPEATPQPSQHTATGAKVAGSPAKADPLPPKTGFQVEPARPQQDSRTASTTPEPAATNKR